MPAELFPTRYRGLCHGISAAFGKLGSVVAQLFLAYINYGHGVNHTRIEKWLPYSLLMSVTSLLLPKCSADTNYPLSFSIFMLLGLITTIRWIPAQEHGPDGTVKTLEQWEVGRPTPNGFSNTWTARTVEIVWKWLASLSMRLYLFVDGLAGGDARERRDMARLERESEEERERMREMEEVERGRNGAHDGVDPMMGMGEVREERGPSPFVNGSAHRS